MTQAPEHEASKKRPRGLTPSGSRLIVAAFAASCATIIVCLPAALPPALAPPIWPDAAEAALAADIEEDARQAAIAETLDGRGVARLRRLYREQGQAEVTVGERPEVARERGLGLTRLLNIAERDREGATAALRGAALHQLWPALRGDLEPDDERALLGAFPRMLERYGAARDGRRLAPRSVVRAMFKARWNVVHGREPTDGFQSHEAEAYWGWAALHAPAASEQTQSVDVRGLAMAAYVQAGGPHARELQAYATYRSGAFARSAGIYGALFDETGHQRFRNHARAALLMSGE